MDFLQVNNDCDENVKGRLLIVFASELLGSETVILGGIRR